MSREGCRARHPWGEGGGLTEEVRALLVGHPGERVVGVGAVRQVGDEPGVVVVLAEELDGLGEAEEPARGLELARGLAPEAADDLALEEDGEALVEPEVLPGPVGDEVARPAVRDLVRHHVDQGAVPREERRGHEGQARVLHAPVREGGRQHQEVVAPPHVLPGHLLGGAQELLGALELVPGALHHGRLGPHAAPVADVEAAQLPDGHGDQVGRHRHPLLEVERRRPRVGRRQGAARGGLPGLGRARGDGAHEGPERLRAAQGRAVRGLDGGRVLAGEHAPGVDRLALAEHERVGLPRRLPRAQELQGRRGRGRPVPDLHLELVAGRGALGEAHAQLLPQGPRLEAQGEVGLLPVDPRVGDVEVAGVEIQGRRGPDHRDLRGGVGRGVGGRPDGARHGEPRAARLLGGHWAWGRLAGGIEVDGSPRTLSLTIASTSFSSMSMLASRWMWSVRTSPAFDREDASAAGIARVLTVRSRGLRAREAGGSRGGDRDWMPS